MTQEDKDLLLKDICARLPYGLVIQEKCLEHDETFLPNQEDDRLVNIDVCEDLVITNSGSWYHIEEVKPYLFPLSSMTEEQKYEYDELIHSNNIKSIEGFITTTDCSTAEIDWLLKNHFDFRCLIPRGLANDATGKGIY